MINDKVTTKSGDTGTVLAEHADGRSYVRVDTGVSGWFETASLTPAQSKAWPPQVEVKSD